MREVKREEFLRVSEKLRKQWKGSKVARTLPVLMRVWKVLETLTSAGGKVLAQIEYRFANEIDAHSAAEEGRHLEFANAVTYRLSEQKENDNGESNT